MTQSAYNRGRRWSSTVGCLAALALLATPLQAQPPAAVTVDDETQDWTSLLDARSLGTWQPIDKADFLRAGDVSVAEKKLVLGLGKPATGVRWTGQFPEQDYELTLEARRTEGEDFFCGLTFPVGDSHVTLILGGWGGWVVGLSCVDDAYAIDNETCTSVPFEANQWYGVRLRVTDSQVQAWVDDQPKIDFDTEGHRLAPSSEMKPCQPLGIATWNTTGEIRNIRYRLLSP